VRVYLRFCRSKIDEGTRTQTFGLTQPPEPKENNKIKIAVSTTLQALGFYSTLTASIPSLVCSAGESHNILAPPRFPLYQFIVFISNVT
jgi:hypothetical protein